MKGDIPMPKLPNKRLKHGHARRNGYSALYRCWQDMMTRCYNPKYKQFKDYGGRGLTVCARWWEAGSFIQEITQNLGARPKGYSFDRIDNSKGYYPENVRWATRREQVLNRRCTRVPAPQ